MYTETSTCMETDLKSYRSEFLPVSSNQGLRKQAAALTLLRRIILSHFCYHMYLKKREHQLWTSSRMLTNKANINSNVIFNFLTLAVFLIE